jgi:hypothetical protein
MNRVSGDTVRLITNGITMPALIISGCVLQPACMLILLAVGRRASWLSCATGILAWHVSLSWRWGELVAPEFAGV